MADSTELREALDNARAFIADSIDNGHLSSGDLGNAYGVRDEVDKALRLIPRDHSPPAGSALEALREIADMLEEDSGPAGVGNAIRIARDLLSRPPQQDDARQVVRELMEQWPGGSLPSGPLCVRAARIINAQEDDATGGGVPAGWRLVPEEPTRHMLHRMNDAVEAGGKGWWERAYAALLAAAPKGVGQ